MGHSDDTYWERLKAEIASRAASEAARCRPDLDPSELASLVERRLDRYRAEADQLERLQQTAFALARFAIRDLDRRAARERRLRARLASEMPVATETIATDDLRELYLQQLLDLDSPTLECLRLRFVGGLKIHEIARATGTSAATVSRQINQARDCLRAVARIRANQSRRSG